MGGLLPIPGGEGYESPLSEAIDISEVDGGAGLGVDPGVARTAPLVVAAAAAAADDGGEADLEHLTNAELQSMLSARGLPTYGTKAELIERLNTA